MRSSFALEIEACLDSPDGRRSEILENGALAADDRAVQHGLVFQNLHKALHHEAVALGHPGDAKIWSGAAAPFADFAAIDACIIVEFVDEIAVRPEEAGLGRKASGTALIGAICTAQAMIGAIRQFERGPFANRLSSDLAGRWPRNSLPSL